MFAPAFPVCLSYLVLALTQRVKKKDVSLYAMNLFVLIFVVFIMGICVICICSSFQFKF